MKGIDNVVSRGRLESHDDAQNIVTDKIFYGTPVIAHMPLQYNLQGLPNLLLNSAESFSLRST